MCAQVNPGHGDFGEHVGFDSGRENQAVRPGQQSSLQAVQTGEKLKVKKLLTGWTRETREILASQCVKQTGFSCDAFSGIGPKKGRF